MDSQQKYDFMARIIDYCESHDVYSYDDVYDFFMENAPGCLKVFFESDFDFVVRRYLNSRLREREREENGY